MASLQGYARNVYHQLVPYDLRIVIWSKYRRFDRDRIPHASAAPAERYAVRMIGYQALQNSQFAQAIVARHPTHGPEHSMLKTWVEYALSTNERGDAVIQTIQCYTDIPGKRHLDIGCAYGGTPIAFARAGAEAYGVEIEPGLAELAQLNLADHPGIHCTVQVADILQPKIAESMGKFDIITGDNVIEHVAKASTLVQVIAQLLKPTGIGHVSIPNAFSYSEVARDGHYGLLGLTLLERDRAEEYFHAAGNADSYGVGEYCFTFDEYQHLFAEAGLTMELMNPVPFSRRATSALEQRVADLPELFEKQVHQKMIPAELQRDVWTSLERYGEKFRSDLADYRDAGNANLAASLGTRLLRNYQQDLWQVLVHHQ